MTLGWRGSDSWRVALDRFAEDPGGLIKEMDKMIKSLLEEVQERLNGK